MIKLQRNEYRTTAEIDMGGDDFVTVQVVYHVDGIDGDIDELNVYDEFWVDVSHLVTPAEMDKCREAAWADQEGEATESARIVAEDRAENRKESGLWMTRKAFGGAA